MSDSPYIGRRQPLHERSASVRAQYAGSETSDKSDTPDDPGAIIVPAVREEPLEIGPEDAGLMSHPIDYMDSEEREIKRSIARILTDPELLLSHARKQGESLYITRLRYQYLMTGRSLPRHWEPRYSGEGSFDAKAPGFYEQFVEAEEPVVSMT